MAPGSNKQTETLAICHPSCSKSYLCTCNISFAIDSAVVRLRVPVVNIFGLYIPRVYNSSRGKGWRAGQPGEECPKKDLSCEDRVQFTTSLLIVRSNLRSIWKRGGEAKGSLRMFIFSSRPTKQSLKRESSCL